MEISGKVAQILNPVTGKSNKGPWKKQEIILDIPGKFDSKLAVANWNDKVDISSLSPGVEVKFSVNIDSREYNGRWFTEVKIWKMEIVDSMTEDALPDDLPTSFSLDNESDPFSEDASADDLPF